MGLTVHFEVLNQLGTPMMYSATLANRPAAGIAGRIFFRTDSPFGIYRDTGSAWDQISSAGGGNTIYTGDDTLTSNRTVSSGGFTLVFTPQTTFFSSLTAAVNASSFSVLGSNTLNYAAGFSSNNIGNVYSANGAINSQIFVGDATFAQANLASAMVNVNKIDFSSGGHTVTMTQSGGIRAMTGVQNQIQFVGSHNGRITHAAVSQNLGFFRDTGSTSTLTITNAYSHLINALDDYGAGFTFTNRWGTYQAGATDTNYFAANCLFGTTVNAGFRVDVNGTARVSGSLTLVGGTYAQKSIYFDSTLGLVISSATGATYDLTLTNANGSGQLFIKNNVVTIPNQANINGLTIGGNGFAAPGIFNSPVYGNTIFGNNSASTYCTSFVSANGSDGIFQKNNGNIHIGSLATTFSASAYLQINSTTQGFRPPAMTNAQRTAISSPAVGLIVYCTDAVEGLYIYKSTGWTLVI